jgi:hypothetical protein
MGANKAGSTSDKDVHEMAFQMSYKLTNNIIVQQRPQLKKIRNVG